VAFYFNLGVQELIILGVMGAVVVGAAVVGLVLAVSGRKREDD
jgi:hypothetical protein